MKANNVNTKSTYTVGKTVLNEDGSKAVVHEERLVAVTLTTYEDTVGVFWKGARVA